MQIKIKTDAAGGRGELAELARLAAMAVLFMAAFALAPLASDWLAAARSLLPTLEPPYRAIALAGFIFAVLALGPIARLIGRGLRRGDTT